MAAPYYVYGGNLLNREKYTSVVNTTFGDRRYFSSIDTDVYFGDVHIDEMVAFDFIIEEKKIPLFGYNNFTAKRLITGQKTIQGSFAINFTQTFNLKYIIDGLADSIYANQYEEAQFYCADDNRALFGKGFDITLSYGDAKGEGSYNACTQTLVGCYITSYRQAFDTSGEPILDMYTFIAKDLLVISDSSTSTDENDDGQFNDPIDKIENEGHDACFVGNELDETENGKAYEKYEESKGETLCISIRPAYTYVDGASKITMRIDAINNVKLKVSSVKLSITDNALGAGSYDYTLSEVNSNYFAFTMTGTQVNVGKKIKKYFEDPDNKYLDCHIDLVCSDGREHRVEKETKLYDEDTVMGG